MTRALSCIVLLLACATAFPQEVSGIPAHVRDYDLGLAYMPASRSMPIEKAYDKIKEAAETAYIQGNWHDWTRKDFLTKDVEVARGKGLKIYIALDLLGYSPPRAKVEAPGELDGDFTTPAIRDAYLQLVRKLASECKPHVFNLLVEADMHKKFNPKSYAAFKELLPQAAAEVKKASPQSLVAVSITYDPDEGHFKSFAADFDPSTDLFAVSTYPHFLKTPASMPDDFLEKIGRASRKPLFVSETSWESHSFDISKTVKFQTSPELQADYLRRLANAARFAQEKGQPIAAINFVALIDPPEAVCKAIIASNPTLEWFCYLGVLEADGKEKPAFNVLKAWRQLKRR